MAKPTFLNLPVEKQQFIREQAYRIFTDRNYEEIGVRDIAKACQISVGAFYKYFEDKDDMYLHFFHEMEEVLLQEDLSTVDSVFLITPYNDITRVLSPLQVEFHQTWMKVPNDVMMKFYFGGYSRRLHRGLREELLQLKKEGKVNPLVDVELIFFTLYTSMFSFIQYAKKMDLRDRKDFNELKHQYFLNFVLRNVFTKEYYEEHIRAANVVREEQ